MFSLFKRFRAYERMVGEIGSFGKISPEELVALKQKNRVLEELADDECKRALFRDFAKGKVSNDYADGYLTALAVRKHYTHPGSE
jgi:hypothetical protein